VKGDTASRTKGIDPSQNLTPKQIKALKPPELKTQLSARGLSTQGNKKELIERLLASSPTA
jgi:hypothetical protein